MEQQMNEEKKPQEGGIQFGDQAKVEGDVFTGEKHTEIDVGGIHDVSGGTINIAGRNIVSTQISSGLSAAEVAQLFDQIYAKIEARPDTPAEDKSDLKAEVEEIQAAVAKDGEPDESFLARRLRNIGRMAPDILDVVVATLGNPAAGFGLVIKKIAQRMKETPASAE